MSSRGDKRYIGYELRVASKPHISTRKEDIKVAAPLDKRLLVMAAFNGPTDPNFAALVQVVVNAMDD